jgi:hypothetical protein
MDPPPHGAQLDKCEDKSFLGVPVKMDISLFIIFIESFYYLFMDFIKSNVRTFNLSLFIMFIETTLLRGCPVHYF